MMQPKDAAGDSDGNIPQVLMADIEVGRCAACSVFGLYSGGSHSPSSQESLQHSSSLQVRPSSILHPHFVVYTVLFGGIFVSGEREALVGTKNFQLSYTVVIRTYLWCSHVELLWTCCQRGLDISVCKQTVPQATEKL